jgi:4a-hydroxytetrahydrobiopterin dehydratase
VQPGATVPPDERYAASMALLAAEDVSARLQKLPGWNAEGSAITRQFTFQAFPDAVAFIVRLGFAAESVDHHPDLLVNYRRVTVTFTTHSDGGLTSKDFDGAATATQIAAAMGAS